MVKYIIYRIVHLLVSVESVNQFTVHGATNVKHETREEVHEDKIKLKFRIMAKCD